MNKVPDRYKYTMEEQERQRQKAMEILGVQQPMNKMLTSEQMIKMLHNHYLSEVKQGTEDLGPKDTMLLMQSIKALSQENEQLNSAIKTLEYKHEQLIRESEDLEQQVEQLNKDLKKAYYQGREHGEGNAEIRQDLITDNARLVEENNALKKQLESAIIPKFKIDDEIYYLEFDDETSDPIIKQGRVWQLKISNPKSHLTYMVVGCTGTESICGVQERFCFATQAEADAALKELSK